MDDVLNDTDAASILTKNTYLRLHWKSGISHLDAPKLQTTTEDSIKEHQIIPLIVKRETLQIRSWFGIQINMEVDILLSTAPSKDASQ